jgi:hypothetical protein
MVEQTENGLERTSSSESGPEDSATPVDAFILFNEQEKVVPSIVEELSALGVSTHFWRRDIKPGEPWEEIERTRLSTAGAVVIFLGDQGWGPNHLRLALEAQIARKRTIPVLVGNPPVEAFAEAGGIFERLRYVDLRSQSPAALRILADAIRPGERTGQFAGIISVLVDGNEEQRSAVLQQVIKGTFVDRRGLSNRLRDEIQNRFSLENERRFASAVRDPKKMPSVRSWMLSVLIWTDAEYVPNRQLILKHLDPKFEIDRNVRFWALAGLYQCDASYLRIAFQSCLFDPTPEVALLAEAIQFPGNPIIVERFRAMLFSDDFENKAWPALRVLRVLTIPALANDLCNVLDRSAGDSPLAYDALYALANPPMAAEAAPILQKTRGIDQVIDIIIGVAGSSDAGSTRHFASLLAAFDPMQIETALGRAEVRNPEAIASIRTLRRHVRELHRHEVAPESYVAGYASDDIDVTRDDLDIRADVQTLTAVMLASEVKPPLAIGLFGDWGTGKSFFIDSMMAAAQRISVDARRKSNPKFRTEIVQIKFNAWHYADTNLWASLVSHILESLAKHVSPLETPQDQQARLVKELGSAKEVLSQIKTEREKTEAQITERQDELQRLQLERGQKELELRDLRLNDLQNLFTQDPALQQELKTALEEAGVPAALSNVADLTQAVAEVNSLRGRITGLTVGLFKAKKGPLVVLLIVITLVLPFLGHWLHEWLKSSFVLVATVVAEIAAFIGGAATLLSKAAGYLKTTLDKVETAKQHVDKALAERRKDPSEQEKDLQKAIVALKAEEEQVASRLQAATEKVIDLERRITALTESRSLARFLSERTKSDDYRKHLGVISTIRQDFEALTEQLTNPVTTPGASLRKVERIILYIDDLDRCPADKVVDVLQAVHLLLAYPLFVVVVGVDPRWLAHSLAATYGALKGLAEPPGDRDLWRTTPQNYLEKIFQVPFSLRPMTPTGYAKLIQGLFSSATAPAGSSTRSEPPTAQTTRASPASEQPIETADMPQGGTANAPQGAQSSNPGETSARPDEPGEDPFTIHDEAMVIKPAEAAFAERLYTLLPTPRATKRFSNTYRILKAPILPDQLEVFEGTEQMPGTFQVPMLLLAILIGMPSEAAILFPGLFDRVTKGHDPVEDLAALETLGFKKDVPVALREKVAEIVADNTFPRSPDLFAEWLPRVSRFSFEIGRAIKPAFISRNRT